MKDIHLTVELNLIWRTDRESLDDVDKIRVSEAIIGALKTRTNYEREDVGLVYAWGPYGTTDSFDVASKHFIGIVDNERVSNGPEEG